MDEMDWNGLARSISENKCIRITPRRICQSRLLRIPNDLWLLGLPFSPELTGLASLEFILSILFIHVSRLATPA